MNYTSQILSGTVYLHYGLDHPIIHGDLKCENIMVNCVRSNCPDTQIDYVLKVGDLDSSVRLKDTMTQATDWEKSIVYGTVSQMAPEVILHKKGEVKEWGRSMDY